MNTEQTVFVQLTDFIPTYEFQLCVDRDQSHRYVKDFSCWDQFLFLAFAQLTYRESLRDIESLSASSTAQALSYGLPRSGVSRQPDAQRL